MILELSDRAVLAPNALPTIFEELEPDTSPPSPSLECYKCSESIKKLTDLEQTLQQMKIEHDIELQSLHRKIEHLTNTKADIAVNKQKEILEMRKANEKLLHENMELKQIRYFSTKTGETQNVCYKLVIWRVENEIYQIQLVFPHMKILAGESMSWDDFGHIHFQPVIYAYTL